MTKGEGEEAARSVGRPRKELDLKLVIELAKIQCTAEEMCGVLGMCEDTLVLRLKELGYENFSDFREQYSAQGKVSLRRFQFAAARKGNPALLIWLGRQYLGQADRRELTGAGGGPVETREVPDRPYSEWTLEELQAEVNARSASA